MEAVLKKGKNAKAIKTTKTVIHYVLLCVLALFLIFPFFVMVMRSFMGVDDIWAARIFPTKFTIENYRKVCFENNYFHAAWNTLKVVLFNIIAVPLSSSICAYSFARLKWKGKEIAFSCVLSTMMIPGTVLQVPLYVLFYDLGWIGTLLPMTLPTLFGGGAMNIFLIRQFMRSLPKEMDEAAYIDGAGIFRRYFFIVLPLCKPILIYVMVGTFSAAWSDFFSPLIYLTGFEDKYTLAVKIYQDSIFNSILETPNLKMAAGTFMSILPLILFAFFQRTLIDGVMIGAVKG